MKESLFVYGTLMPNCPNAFVLENIVGKFVKASVKGKLIDAGWSASMGYPGIRLDAGNDTIHGFLFYSDNLINHWDNLDKFEGEEFERKEVIVERFDEMEVQTYIYVLKDEIVLIHDENR
ncbi:gamma-glutamylcyclotransferase family protein [Aliarcobacter cibarius]|uniref:Putative gamma-glutamylcyclotransferase n=1 Tax=Aliarcobacter cibarius TaxID=255507 RepID=A0ABY2V5V3_9BACT|nr:gamma-glutamylcyclotransferase family protein [Aliarcobacter cibarius]TLT00909.1 gamma-glutamylcyclotransferase [Aliarcobacter cibarius]TLT01479.1 gamma-glutamylcyclotransferase [Aliarcobacter cibarius]TLT02829.1 gamma-glutamylcyclotransferase [Aliarcobacter cibarius]